MAVTADFRTTLSDGSRYTYQRPWNGKPFYSSRSQPLALDTETEVVDVGIPRLALATASNGTQSCVLPPSQVGAFLLAHRNAYFVGHNFTFDFWALNQHLRLNNEHNARRVLWDAIDQNRVFDTMILDMLVRIAKGHGASGGAEEGIWARNLDEVASEYSHLSVDKTDPYRMRYVEIIGADFDKVDPGFFEYAVKDAIVTAKAYVPLAAIAQALAAPFIRGDVYGKEVYTDAVTRYGVLTQSLQVKASIALAHMEHQGLCIDGDKVANLEHEYRSDVEDVIEFMRCVWPQIFEVNKLPWNERKKRGSPQYHPDPMQRDLKVAPKSKTPSIKTKELQKLLNEIAEELDIDPPLSSGKKKGISTSVKCWQEYQEFHPFLKAWAVLANSSKLLGFIANARRDRVMRPRYGLLKLTGRTSSFSPNLQQWPKLAKFRELFIPRPGYKLMTIDYSAIELCTLAAVCKQKFGYSTLADIIRSGTDPHAYTASMLIGTPLEAFMTKKTSESAEERSYYKSKRQSAKAVNFGVPGGLGPNKLVAYAKTQYGADLSIEEAAAFRYRLIQEIYPELNDKDGYLADETWKNLAFNLRLPERTLRQTFDAEGEKGFITARALGKILKGKPCKLDGTPYKEDYVERMWNLIQGPFSFSQRFSTDDRNNINNKQGSPALFYKSAAGSVPSLTGRVRGAVDYTQHKNTRFQSLAADGGKMALWNLLRAGFRIVGFVHDEILIELPEATAEQDALRVQQIMQDSMSEVLNHAVPVSTEYHVGDFWIK